MMWAILIVFFMTLTTGSLHAQDNANFEIGLKPFGAYQMGNIDSVGFGNGSLAADIPLISYPQRGGKLKLEFSVHYSNAAYSLQYVCYQNYYCGWVTYPVSAGMGVIDEQEVSTSFTPTTGGPNSYNVLRLIDSDGAGHLLGATGTNLLESLDATGYHATGGSGSSPSYPFVSVIDKKGISYVPNNANCRYGFVGFSVVDSSGYSTLPRVCAGSRSDPNGNQITFSSTSGWTDSMGRAIPLPTKSTNQGDFTGCTGSQTISFVLLWNPPGVNGGTYPLKFCYFAENSSGSWIQYELQSVVLPDNTTWTFQYTPAGSTLPSLSQIIFPTGGSLSYTWTALRRCQPTSSSEQDWTESLVTRTLNPNDGVTAASTWSYAYSAYLASPVQTIVSAPPSTGSTPDDAVHTFLGGCFLYETQKQEYQGSHTSGSLLGTTNTTYHYLSMSGFPGNYTTLFNVVSTNVTTAWANGQTNQGSFTYDSGFNWQLVSVPTSPPYNTSGYGTAYQGAYGLNLTKQEYDYGNGAPGALLRTTTNSYLALNNSSYLSADMLDLLSSVQVTGAGPGSYTTYNYDENNGSPQGVLGNLTSTHRWLNTNGTYLVTSSVYDSYGRITSTTDPKNNPPTTYGYGGSYAGSGPTSVTNALGQVTSYAYDFNTGLLTSTTDPNSKTTQYHYDNMLRTTEIDYPDTGQTTFSYPTADEVDISEKMNTSGQYKTASLQVDGVGRETRQIVSNGESLPKDQVDTCYDGNGRVSFKAYTYQGNGFSTSRVCSGAGDSFAYDALGRTASVTHSDGTSVLTSYTGRATSVQDEGNGTQRVQRISQVDGLGRLTSVCEVHQHDSERRYRRQHLAHCLRAGHRGNGFLDHVRLRRTRQPDVSDAGSAACANICLRQSLASDERHKS
jgi:YD repeat-containing protein